MMALVAVFAFSAVTASGALAAKKGEIVNKEGKAPVKNKFTGKSNKAGLLETEAGSKITCKETGLSGTILTTKTGSATFTFTGCESGGFKCKSGSETAGTIIVKVNLAGAVVAEKDYIENTLEKETEVVCTGLKIKIKGALLIPVSPEETLQTEYVFAATGSKGKQTPEIAANHLEAQFVKEGSKFEKASLSATELKTTFEEAVKAI